jgi:hypothetical protein
MAIKTTIYEALINRGKIQSRKEILNIIREYKKRFNITISKEPLKYLSRHNYIRRIFGGFYYINSFDERLRGFCEFQDQEVVFATLNKMNLKWYVGLTSAIYLEGKIWQTPNRLLIVNTKFSGLKNVFGLQVKFYKSKESLFEGLKQKTTKKGISFFYSDLSKSYIDMVYFKTTKKLTKLNKTKEYLNNYPEWVGKR